MKKIKKKKQQKNEKEAFRILKEVGAIITNSHVVYTSGKHGSTYMNKDAVYPYTKKISKLCETIAKKFANSDVQIVIAPAIGGIILSQWVAKHLNTLTGKEVLSVYSEKDGDNFIIKRGYDKLVKGKNVLVIEDVLTTGNSARKVIEATRAIGGNVVGLGVLCNRGGIRPEDVGSVPKFYSLININMDAWEETECSLCKKGVAINTDVGKGKEFLARKQKK